MTERRPSLLAIFLSFVQIGLSSVGGAAGPLRYVLVVRRRWLGEGEFSEIFGIAQALPGATGANVTAMVADRFGRLWGVVAGLGGFSIPSMFLAIALLTLAVHLATASTRFVAGETAVTAAVAGLFIGNGLRLAWALWAADRSEPPMRRAARLGIVAGGIVLIVGFHLLVPAAVVILACVSCLLEWKALR